MPFLAVLSTACADVCNEAPIPGEFRTTGTGQGTGELDSANGTQPFSFTSNDVVVGGIISETSSSAHLTVTSGTLYAAFDLPDVRPLVVGTKVSLPTEGSIFMTDVDFCNFATTTGMLTIDSAAGTEAPAPSFVTPDFIRSGTVVFETAPRAGSPANCPTRIAIQATMTMTASGYVSVDEVMNCPDLSK